MTEVAVIDSSAAVFACTDLSGGAESVSVRSSRTECHAPHLSDAQVAITFYDALYAALVETLGAPLLTTDKRTARAPGPPGEVEVVV